MTHANWTLEYSRLVNLIDAGYIHYQRNVPVLAVDMAFLAPSLWSSSVLFGCPSSCMMCHWLPLSSLSWVLLGWPFLWSHFGSSKEWPMHFGLRFFFFVLLLRVEKIDLYDPLFLSRWALSLHSNPTERKLHSSDFKLVLMIMRWFISQAKIQLEQLGRMLGAKCSDAFVFCFVCQTHFTLTISYLLFH